MITVQTGSTKVLILKGLATVAVSSSVGSASISFNGEVLAAAHTGNKIYGPFKVPGKFTIVATSGEVQYQIDTARNKAVSTGTYVNLAELAAIDASMFPRGSLAHVGPDVYGQYSEWYSNGVRWRPRNKTLVIQGTPSSLPDTTSTETDVWSYTIPAPLIGPKDLITANYLWTYTNNATNKEIKLYFGGQLWTHLATNAGAGFRGTSYALMRNSKSVQVWAAPAFGIAFADGAGSSGSAVVRNVNTEVDLVIKAAAKWASGGGGGANSINMEYLTLQLEFEA